MDSRVGIDYNINSIGFHELARGGNALRWLTHVFRWHSFTHAIHFAIQGLLAGPSNFLQQREAWKQHIRAAHISNGWLIWHGFLQVLLEIMSGLIIFECCLQGLLTSPFTAQRQRMHQSEGDTTLNCTSSPLCHFKVKLWSFTRSVRLVDGLPAWNARIKHVSRFFSLTFNTLDWLFS